MKKSFEIIAIALVVMCVFNNAAFSQQDPITAYYNRLKESKAKGDTETAYLSVGSDMLYALEYFEAKNYSSASYNFAAILRQDPENAYANFLYGVCLGKLGKGNEARPYIEKAARIMPSLTKLADSQIGKLEIKEQKSLFDDAGGEASEIKKEAEVKEDKPAVAVKTKSPEPAKTAAAAKAKPAVAAKPAAGSKAGGKLVLGSYVCDYQQYQGNRSFGSAYKSVYKGYFVLKADGTYRWLDNGGTGKYSYNAQTGKITWLSGHMKTMAPLATTFTDGQKVASINVDFSDNYSWGCGCNK